MLDLFQPPKVTPKSARTVRLLVDEPRPKPGRKFTGPKRPRKPYKRTPEQNRQKYARYLAAHGREHINAMRRARRADCA